MSTEAKVPGKWPRTWAPGQLFFMKSKAGNKLLVERKGLKGIKPHYLLKPTVTLVGKGYVARALRQAKPKILEIVGNEVKLALKENL